MMHTLRIRIGAVVALAFAALFYVSAVAMALGMAWLSYHVALFVPSVRGRATIFVLGVAVVLIFASLVVAWSLLPRWEAFRAPGILLDRAKHPMLFKEIDRLGAMSGERQPESVYLVPDVNAFVTERGGFLGFGSTRVMGIGLPLLGTLTVAQLRSVLAHEYGHFSGGDVKLLAWIVRARAAMVRSLFNLQSAGHATGEGIPAAALLFRVIAAPFELAAKGYLRLTLSLSRAQEIAADGLAVRLCGSETHIKALEVTEEAASAHGSYLRLDVVPLVETGHVPPLATGFRAFLGNETVRAVLRSTPQAIEVSPYDSHPPLTERVAFARELATRVAPRGDDQQSALELLSSLEATELDLMRFVTGREALRNVSWERSGGLLQNAWRQKWTRLQPFFSNVTIEWLPRTPMEMSEFMRTRGFSTASPGQVLNVFREGLELAVFLALVDAGFEVVNRPGSPPRFVRGEDTFETGEALDEFLGPTGDRSKWRARWEAIGMADAPVPGAQR